MVSEKCRYGYFKREASGAGLSHKEYSSWENIKELFNTKIISEISGYSDCVVISTKTSFLVGLDSKPLSESASYMCRYHPTMIYNLFNLHHILDDIFNSHIGYRCETADQAKTFYMAKILGGRND